MGHNGLAARARQLGRRNGLFCMILSLCFFAQACVAGALAETVAPGFGRQHVRLDMPLVSPEQAAKFFATRVVPKSDAPRLFPASRTSVAARPLNVPLALGHEMPVGQRTPSGFPRAPLASVAKNAAALSCTPPSSPDPEIPALARALNYDFMLIYEYIYYNIEFTPIFGSKKGALGTLLDKSGTNYDQNALFFTLLQQSCYNPSLVYGTVTYPAIDIAHLLGVGLDYNLIYDALKADGIPATITLLQGTTPGTVTMNVFWTQVTVGSATYQVDPSFKWYTQYAPIDMATATGYTQSALLSAALSGASAASGLPSGVTSLQNLNKANISSSLSNYAANLANYIETNAASSTTAQIFGGQTITSTNYLASYGGANVTPIHAYTTLPTTFETAYTINIYNNGVLSGSATLYASQISGRRLTLTYPNATPTLALEGATIPTGAPAATAATQTIRIVTSTPGPALFLPVDQTVLVGSSYAYAIMLVSGDTGRDTLTRHQNKVADYLQQGSAATSEPVTGESLAAMGAAYLGQLSRASQRDGKCKSTLHRHCGDQQLSLRGFRGFVLESVAPGHGPRAKLHQRSVPCDRLICRRAGGVRHPADAADAEQISFDCELHRQGHQCAGHSDDRRDGCKLEHGARRAQQLFAGGHYQNNQLPQI
jgi:hypothetical protein